MSLQFVLGVATGVGITLLLKSSYSKKIVETAGERAARGLLTAEDALHSAIEKSENLRIKLIDQTHQS